MTGKAETPQILKVTMEPQIRNVLTYLSWYYSMIVIKTHTLNGANLCTPFF